MAAVSFYIRSFNHRKFSVPVRGKFSVPFLSAENFLKVESRLNAFVKCCFVPTLLATIVILLFDLIKDVIYIDISFNLKDATNSESKEREDSTVCGFDNKERSSTEGLLVVVTSPSSELSKPRKGGINAIISRLQKNQQDGMLSHICTLY